MKREFHVDHKIEAKRAIIHQKYEKVFTQIMQAVKGSAEHLKLLRRERRLFKMSKEFVTRHMSYYSRKSAGRHFIVAA